MCYNFIIQHNLAIIKFLSYKNLIRPYPAKEPMIDSELQQFLFEELIFQLKKIILNYTMIELKKRWKLKYPSAPLLLCVFCGLVSCRAEASELTFKGYLENRTLLNIDSSTLAGRNRARVEVGAKPVSKAYLNLTADFMSLHGDLSRAKALLPADSVFSERVSLDRSYLRLNFKRWQLIAGKQRIAWGLSLRWSPFDVFNRINLLESTEEKPGINAFRLSLPLSSTNSIEASFIPQIDLDSSSYGLRSYFNLLNTGVELYAIRDAISRDVPTGRLYGDIFGITLKGDLEVGWWFEGAYVLEGERRKAEDGRKISSSNPEPRFEMVMGSDYTFTLGDGLYLMVEYRYNGAGESNAQKYDYSQLLTDRRPLLGRNYISLMIRYNFSPQLNSVIIYTANLDDQSGILIPNLQYQIFQDVQMILGSNLFLGEGEYHLPKGKLPFSINHQVYLWLRADF